MSLCSSQGLGGARLISLVLMASLWGCNLESPSPFEFSLPSNSITPIESLSPTASETVYVQGRVVKVIPLLNRYAYQLEDDTGIVVVLTTGEVQEPAIGDSVKVRGQLRHQSIPIQGQELGEVYVLELERL
ncbi:hypothetical protein [Roseofilum capinflatum]|uniref:NirD/YgiW/YdeI family stress tolerance protein n=1 Tax=Roseofilum capinflatum BLCC-M114 TaxID=3022440 RepID=A0ABT7BA27_9CYAN|nr:hypothetical protein [Roseofilum capinflatum]MDJ1175148.1 hypothetical protein [Roseofilum capinflatum BLCC-M114]